MRPSIGLVGLLLLVAPTVLSQTLDDLPELSTVTQSDGDGKTTTAAPESTAKSDEPSSTAAEETSTAEATSAPASSSADATQSESGSATSPNAFRLTGLPTIAGVGIPDMKVPDTAGAPFMQKSNLPDGTVFICVGAVLAFLGAAVLAWRGLVAWSLHRSVKRAAMAQNLADLKAMSAVPGKKRGLYNVVGASSNMSLDRLSAAPTGTSKPPKPFASTTTGTPPKSTSSLFFSPTAGGAGGLRDSVNRSSNYLPAGYYASGNAQAASGSPMTHVGGHASHQSMHSLHIPGNRFSTRSGISPPGSPSLPPSRGYDRPPPSRDGISLYNRNSVATLGTPANGRGIYGHEHGNPSQLSLNVPGGSSVTGGRAPSAYLEDLFENHGNGPRERF
ncbi:hypothetical protein BU26DRAFT_415882 [Trematosphaeria pertusa]|uniref:CSI2 protein n=1 Tax=Trematosphaeria pertusa TaxID=390896 RepID=A0A6A6J0N5_9PLEO|nr:uncharacterized protein BU26DRAFT_415882 [Trematosphaeria pertusa]KAF2255420.1 hypothetical protein BU26DRAFT_415882 [Trematosphaeria pertusa]